MKSPTRWHKWFGIPAAVFWVLVAAFVVEAGMLVSPGVELVNRVLAGTVVLFLGWMLHTMRRDYLQFQRLSEMERQLRSNLERQIALLAAEEKVRRNRLERELMSPRKEDDMLTH